MQRVFHDEHIQVHFDPREQRCVLRSGLSLERHTLPAGVWQLDADGGDAILFRVHLAEDDMDDGAVVELDDLLDFGVYESGKGAGRQTFVVNLETGGKVNVTVRRAARWLKQVLVPAGLAGAQIAIDSCVLGWLRGGCRLFWSLGDAHKKLGLSQLNGNSAKWANHMLPTLMKWLEQIDVPSDMHIMKSREYNGAKGSTNNDGRLVNFHCISTIGLLLACARWAFCTSRCGGFSGEGDRAKMAKLLEGILSMLKPGGGAFGVVLVEHIDGKVQWPFFSGSGYTAKIVVQYPAMQVDITSMKDDADSGNLVAKKWLTFFDGDTRKDMLGLMRFLGGFNTTSGQAWLLLKQIAIAISGAIDEQIAGAFAEDDSADGALVEPSASCGERHLQEHLASYVAGSRAHVRAIFGEQRMASITLDDSNVRGMELCSSAVIMPDNVGFWVAPQVVQKCTDPLELAREEGGEEKALLELKMRADRQMQWLKRGRDPQEKLRTAGLSLAEFQIPEKPECRLKPQHWPLLGVSADRRSIGVCAIGYAHRKMLLNLDEVYDMSHGAWDDAKQSIRDCGLQPFLLLAMVAVSVFDGPWADNGRYNEAVQTMRALWKDSRPNDLPLFQELLVKLAREMGQPPGGVDLESFVWSKLQVDSCLSKRGFKCNLNRFYGFIEVSEKEVLQYHQKFFVLLHTALEMDFLGGKKVSKLKIGRSSGGNEAPRTTSAIVPSSEEKALRASRGNAFALATLFYSDLSNAMRWKAIVLSGSPPRRWQGMMNKALRSVDSYAPWLAEQRSGGFSLCMKDCTG